MSWYNPKKKLKGKYFKKFLFLDQKLLVKPKIQFQDLLFQMCGTHLMRWNEYLLWAYVKSKLKIHLVKIACDVWEAWIVFKFHLICKVLERNISSYWSYIKSIIFIIICKTKKRSTLNLFLLYIQMLIFIKSVLLL